MRHLPGLNLAQRIILLTSVAVVIHLVSISLVATDVSPAGWSTYAPPTVFLRADTRRFSILLTSLVLLAGVAMWTAFALWLFASKRDDA